MNILYVLNSGKPGGMEQHVLDLVEGMVQHGNKVFVCCNKGEIVDWYENAGATVFKQEIKYDLDPSYIKFLIKILKEEKIDIIHAHELKAVSNALIAGFLVGVKVRIAHTHTPISEWRTPNLFKTILKHLEVFGYSVLINTLATKEIALTESRKKTKMMDGILISKLELIPNGIEVDKFNVSSEDKVKYKTGIKRAYSIPKDAFVIGNLSRLTPEKGHDLLIRAFAHFLEFQIVDKEDFYLVIAGGGVLEKELKILGRELHISDKLIITGVFEEEDKVKLYSLFDVFVFPSLAEGFGIVLAEAMCVGMPIICSDLPVLKEVGQDHVEYFEAGSYTKLADKLEQIYKTIDLVRLNSGKNHIMNNYSHQNFVDAYLKLYINLLVKKS